MIILGFISYALTRFLLDILILLMLFLGVSFYVARRDKTAIFVGMKKVIGFIVDFAKSLFKGLK